jgi:hypothetical protein
MMVLRPALALLIPVLVEKTQVLAKAQVLAIVLFVPMMISTDQTTVVTAKAMAQLILAFVPPMTFTVPRRVTSPFAMKLPPPSILNL